MYFEHIPSISQLLPDPCHPHLLNFMFFVYKKKKHKDKKNSKTKQKLWGPLCIVQLFFGMDPALECGWYSQWHSFGKNLFSPYQQLSIAKAFLVRGGNWFSFTIFYAGILPGLNLCMSCVCFHNWCEFRHVSVLLCLDDTISLVSSLTPASYNAPTSFSIYIY